MQPAENRMGSDRIGLLAAMTRYWLLVVGIGGRGIRNTRTQRHVRTPGIVVTHCPHCASIKQN